jgi:hypothetical protein
LTSGVHTERGLDVGDVQALRLNLLALDQDGAR